MILVTGATGHVGRAVVCRLASLGHDVVAMARTSKPQARDLPSGFALRVADYEDASALKRALAGIDDTDVATGSYDAETGIGLFSGIFSLVALWPNLAIGVKRCHDRDRSGWFLLVGLIPIIGAIWLFVELGCLRGSMGGNRFGPDPVSTR